MAYSKQNFVDGQVLTASQMNHIENGIADAIPKSSISSSGSSDDQTLVASTALTYSIRQSIDRIGKTTVKINWRQLKTSVKKDAANYSVYSFQVDYECLALVVAYVRPQTNFVTNDVLDIMVSSTDPYAYALSSSNGHGTIRNTNSTDNNRAVSSYQVLRLRPETTYYVNIRCTSANNTESLTIFEMDKNNVTIVPLHP